MNIKVECIDVCVAILAGEFENGEVEEIAMDCFNRLSDECLIDRGNGMYDEDHPQRELAKRIIKRLTIKDFEWLKKEIELI